MLKLMYKKIYCFENYKIKKNIIIIQKSLGFIKKHLY